MADEQVGTVSVKVMPDTKGFRAKLKAFLEQLERSLDLDIEVGLRLNRRDLLQARREIKALQKGAKVNVKLELDKSELVREVRRVINEANRAAQDNPIESEMKVAPWDIREFTRSIRESIDSAISGVEAEVPVELQDEQLRADLARLMADAERMAEVEVTAELDDADFRRAYQELRNEINDVTHKIKVDADIKAAEAQLEGFLQQMRDRTIKLPIELDGAAQAAAQAEELARSRQLDLYAVLHSTLAAAQLAVLTRDQSVKIYATLHGNGITRIAGMLTGLAGIRTLYDLSDQVGQFITEVDRSIPRIAIMASSIGGISAASLAAAGGVAQLATGVGQSLRGLLMVPAAAAGIVTVFQVLKASFKDAGQYIGDLGAQYSALGDRISAGYWSIAEGSIRRFTSAFIPLASTWLPRVGVELGYATEAISKAVTESRGLENLSGFLENTVRGLDVAAGGFGDLTRAILDLVEAGSRQFPALAGWFRQMMRDFEGWTERVTNDGSFDRWMEEAGQATRDLGSILASTTRVFLAFADAAEAAGSPSLNDMAQAMRNVAAAAESTRGMGFMTTMLAGANTGIRRMIPGLRDLGNAFVDLAPQMATVMAISGDIFSELFSGLADVLNNPQFQTGLVDMFEGFRATMVNLRPMFHTLGTDIGMLFETFGMLAEALGRVVGVASEELGTVFQDVLTIVQALIPVLSDWFVGALEAVGPAISGVADAVARLVEEFPEAAALVAVLASAFGLAVLTIGLVARPLVAAASGFVALKSALGGMGLSSILSGITTSLSGVSGGFGAILRIGGRFLGWVGLVVLAFQEMWENSEAFRDSFKRLGDALGDLGEQLGDALAPAVDRLVNESLPDLMDAFGELMSAAEPVFKFLGDSAARTVEGIAMAIEVLTPAIVALADGLAETLGGALEFITSLIETWGAAFRGDWEGVWQGLQDTASAAFETIGSAVETGLSTLTALMESFLDEAFPGWRDHWVRVGNDVLNGIGEGLGMDSSGVINAAIAVGNTIKDAFEATLNGEAGGLQTIGANMVTDLVTGIENTRATVLTAVAGLVTEIVTGFTSLQDQIGIVFSTMFLSVRNQIVTEIAGLITDVTVAMSLLPDAIAQTLEELPVRLSAMTLSWFMGMVAAAAQGQVLLMQEFYLLPSRIENALITVGANLIATVTSWFTGMQTEAVTGTANLEAEVATLPERLRTVLSTAGALLQAEVVLWFVNMRSAALTGVADVVSQLATLPSRARAAVAPAGALLAAQATAWMNVMRSAVISGLATIVAQFATLPGRVLAAISAIPNIMLQQATQWFVNMRSAVTAGIASVVAQMAQLGAQILAVVNTIPAQMFSVGVDMIRGLINGIQSMASSVASAARGVVEGAVNAAKQALNINSPSKVFMQIGEYTGAGFVKGIESSRKSTRAAMTRMVTPPRGVVPAVGGYGRGGQEINVTVQAQPGEDPTRIGRRAGEALAFEIGRQV